MSTASPLIIAILVVSILLLIGGIVLTFMSNRWAILSAFAGMCGVSCSIVYDHTDSLIFWGVAAVIVIALQYLLPRNVVESRRGVGYMAGAALAGAFVGMVISHGWMVVGAVIGAVLGAIAYSRTPVGKMMEFPSSKFLNYLCAKGLPAVITMCIVGTTVLWLTSMLP
ncbi:MAG: hypothetical protein NC212_04120 [Staphylococcus sp.]|nr:hypothetical protein [Staphylococcus sp.]